MAVMPGERALTVAGPGRAVDLRVPAGVPVGDLLPALARTVGVPPGESGWDLVPIGGPPLPLDAPLAATTVGDGDVLCLRAHHPAYRAPAARSVRDRLPLAQPSKECRVGWWSSLVEAMIIAALVLPLLGAVGIGLTSLTDGPAARPPSVAFVLGAVAMALLGGWVRVRDEERRVADPAFRPAIPLTVAGAAGVAWAGIGGGALVDLAAPSASPTVVAAGCLASAFGASLVGGWWCSRRASGSSGWSAIAGGVYGLASVGVAAALAAVLGADAAARLVTVVAALSVGALPGLAVLAGGALRSDRLAAGAGISAATADEAAERAAGILRGALGGSVLVSALAAVSRWPDPGPVDVAVIGSAALLWALRARTLGRRFAGLPTVGAAVSAVIAVAAATTGAPVDRVLVTLAGVVAVLGAVLVVTEHRAPPSPAGAACSARLARWIECTVIVLVIPLAAGAVDVLIKVAAAR